MSTATRPNRPESGIPPVPVRRFSVAEYRTILDTGIFEDEQVELLEGWIVPKLPLGPPHAVAIGLADEQIRPRLPLGWRLRVRSPIATSDSMVRPDLAIIRGEPRDYLSHHPGPGDIALLVDGADFAHRDDRSLKGRLYANAGIPAHWIVNLDDRIVEVYTDPTGPDPSPCYRSRLDYADGDLVSFSIEDYEIGPIAVADLLP